MTSQFQMIESPAPQKLRIAWEMLTPADESPDVSWLEPDSGRYDDVADAEERARYEAADAERLADYGSGWHMLGVIARARVFIPAGGTSFRVLTLESAGLWGIESDSGDYLREVYVEQKAELMAELQTLGAALASGDFVQEESE